MVSAVGSENLDIFKGSEKSIGKFEFNEKKLPDKIKNGWEGQTEHIYL